MSQTLKRSAAILCLFVAAPTAMAGAEIKEWRFRALLDGREIGYHHFTVHKDGDRQRVESEARFNVKFFVFNAYEYAHENVELWHGNCLDRIEAATNDNGEKSIVRGSANEGSFVVEHNQRETTLPACLQTFAYWDPDFLEADRLLNSQTGEYTDVDVIHLGADTVTIGNTEVAAKSYRLLIEDRRIDLWYTAAGNEWLALEADTEGDRTLRYEPVSIEMIERLTSSAHKGSVNET